MIRPFERVAKMSGRPTVAVRRVGPALIRVSFDFTRPGILGAFRREIYHWDFPLDLAIELARLLVLHARDEGVCMDQSHNRSESTNWCHQCRKTLGVSQRSGP